MNKCNCSMLIIIFIDCKRERQWEEACECKRFFFSLSTLFIGRAESNQWWAKWLLFQCAITLLTWCHTAIMWYGIPYHSFEYPGKIKIKTKHSCNYFQNLSRKQSLIIIFKNYFIIFYKIKICFETPTIFNIFKYNFYIYYFIFNNSIYLYNYFLK